MFYYVAFKALEQAGYKVEAADGVPGLYNVEGVGCDLTLGQLVDVCKQKGLSWCPPAVLGGVIRDLS